MDAELLECVRREVADRLIEIPSSNAIIFCVLP